MTRFARYSTKGVSKPPCEATPWSELAPPPPPAAAAAAPPAPEATPNGRPNKQKGMHSDKTGRPLAASTGKKGKKKGNKRLSLPEASAADFDASEMLLDESITKSAGKLNGKKPAADNTDAKRNGTQDVQSSKKKKKSLLKRSDAPGAEEREVASGPADGMQEQAVDAAPTSKAVKRKNKGGDVPKKKKRKQLETGDKVACLPGDQQSDAPQTQAAADVAPSAPAALNGGDRHLKKKRKQQKVKRMPKAAAAAAGPPLLVEGPLMTQFEGYWVRRRSVPRLERIKAELAATIADPQTLKREMKKRKRAEHRLLLSHLANRGSRPPATAAAKLQSSQPTDGDDAAGDEDEDEDEDEEGAVADEVAAGEPTAVEQKAEVPARRRTVADDRNPSGGSGVPKEERMVKFDGVWMTAEAVGRLKELRRQLKLQRVSDVVLRQTMKTARRREEMKRKRDAKRVCLGCRQPGHFVSECPQRAAGVTAPVTGLCFRCGSTEHRLAECRRPTEGGKLPYAVCFVCGQTGHLSRDCTLNPNGVYPKGGACKVCHRRDHLADDCPEQKEEAAADGAPRLTTISAGGALEDDYQHDFRTVAETSAAPAAPAAGRKPRVVKF